MVILWLKLEIARTTTLHILNYIDLTVFAGAIFDTFGSFRTVFFFNSGCYAVTSVSYLLIIFINRKRPTFFFPTNICDAAVGSVIETKTHTNGEKGNQSTAILDHQAQLRLNSEGAREDDDHFRQTNYRDKLLDVTVIYD